MIMLRNRPTGCAAMFFGLGALAFWVFFGFMAYLIVQRGVNLSNNPLAIFVAGGFGVIGTILTIAYIQRVRYDARCPQCRRIDSLREEKTTTSRKLDGSVEVTNIQITPICKYCGYKGKAVSTQHRRNLSPHT